MDDILSLLTFIFFYTIFSCIFTFFLILMVRAIMRRSLRREQTTEKVLRNTFNAVKTMYFVIFLLFSGIPGAIMYWLKFRTPMMEEVRQNMIQRGYDVSDLKIELTKKQSSQRSSVFFTLTHSLAI